MHSPKKTYSRTEIQLNYGVESNHLGNVLTTISARPMLVFDENMNFSHKNPEVLSVTDYYPFGMIMPGRNYNASSYRWGFGGVHEKDDEWRGITGADLDFGGYGYDALTCRRKGPDPLAGKFPSESPYSAFGNNPIFYVDINGKFKWPTGEEGRKLAEKYPTAYKYLGNPENKDGSILELTSNKEVMTGILDNVGGNLAKQGWYIPSEFKGSNFEVSEGDVKEAYTPGSGTELKITMNPGESSILGGQPSAGGYNESDNGKLYDAPIELNERMFQDLENAKTDEERQAALGVINSTVTHEYLEYFGDDSKSASKWKNGDYIFKNWGAAEGQYQIFGNTRYQPENHDTDKKEIEDK